MFSRRDTEPGKYMALNGQVHYGMLSAAEGAEEWPPLPTVQDGFLRHAEGDWLFYHAGG